MNQHTRLLAYYLSQVWAMEPSALRAYAGILARGYLAKGAQATAVVVQPQAGHKGGGEPALPPAQPFSAAGTRSDGSGPGSIAVVRVFGPIVQRASQLGMCEDGTGTDEIGAALNAAMADPTVGQVLMEFDTPGGSVFGVGELADQIRAARKEKPIVGFANSMSASAGYYLMSQCSECYVTPGGMVGSIGVYTMHQDIAAFLEAEGVKVTLVSAGKYKVEGNPFEPLGEDARGALQTSVNDYYDKFVAAVAKGRGVGVDAVRNGYGEGRCLNADAALEAGLVDGVMPFGDVVKKMQRDAKARKQAGVRSAQAVREANLRLLEIE